MKHAIRITVDDSGKLNVSGPLQDKILMFKLLNAAYDAVLKFKPQIEIPKSSIVGLKKGDA